MALAARAERPAEFFARPRSLTIANDVAGTKGAKPSLAINKGSHNPAVGRDFAIKNVLRQRVGRIGEAKDIAFAVCMIASPLNDFMTGTTFRVDGGATPTV